jgi:hypothetical protein
LVVHWHKPDAEPLLLLASPAARRPARRAEWFVKAYRKRWGVEDATWGIKQRLTLEHFLVRSWRSIRRLLWLVAWVFFWLNLWGEDRYQRLRIRPAPSGRDAVFLSAWTGTLRTGLTQQDGRWPDATGFGHEGGAFYVRSDSHGGGTNPEPAGEHASQAGPRPRRRHRRGSRRQRRG